MLHPIAVRSAVCGRACLPAGEVETLIKNRFKLVLTITEISY